MQYTEAFKRLGYGLTSPRQDWSAEKADGVCISLWKAELRSQSGFPYLDLWESASADAPWTKLSGHAKRTAHLERAVRQFGGEIDAVLVSGEPGKSYKDAEPWMRRQRGGSWRITKFDSDTGFFRAEVQKRPVED